MRKNELVQRFIYFFSTRKTGLFFSHELFFQVGGTLSDKLSLLAIQQTRKEKGLPFLLHTY